MSLDWKSYWAERPPLRRGTLDEALIQVGKTQLGKPVAASQLDMLVAHVVETLGLTRDSLGVDLGCGNGLVTRALAARIAYAVGFDYSPVLLEAARLHFAGTNVAYRRADLGRMEGVELPAGAFDAAWSIEVIQNLDPDSLTRLLKWLAGVMPRSFRFLASGIPDIGQIRAFYDTDERWQRHLENARAGREQMGYWWHVDELAAAAERAGLNVRLHRLPPEYYTAHYRLDALFWRD